MTSPGGAEAGRVFVRVLPNTASFRRGLERYLERVERTTRLQIHTSLDLKPAEARLAAFTRDRSMSVDIDTGDAAKRLADLSQHRQVNIDTDVDLKAAEQKLTAFARQRPGRVVPVRPDLDLKGAERRLGLFTRRRRTVGVDLDTGTAPEQLAALSRDRKVELKVDIDRRALAASASLVRREFAKFAAIGGLVAIAGAVFSLKTGILSLLPLVGPLASGLALASGSLALLPAVAFGAAAGVGALVVGMRGVGKAFKDAGDPKKFAEDLKKLSPAARETVVALHNLAPAMTAVRKAVQEKLFAGLAGPLSTITKLYLPAFKAGLGGIASTANAATRQMAGFLSLPRSLADARLELGNIGKAFSGLPAVVAPALQILRDIAAVGSSFLPGLAGGFGAAARGAAAFVAQARQSGELTKFLSAALQAVGDLAVSLFNLGAGLANIFTAAGTSGAGFLTTLRVITTTFRTLTETAQVKGGFAALFNGISTGVHAAVGALQAGLGPAIAAVGPALGAVAAQVGQVAGSLIRALLPAFTALAPVVATVAQVLGPLLVGAFNILGPALTQLITGLAPLGKLAGTILPPLASGIAGLAPAVLTLVPAFSDLARAVAGTLNQALAAVGPTLAEVIRTLGPALLQSLTSVVPLFVDLLHAVLPLVPPLAKLAATILPPLAAALSHMGPAVQAAALGFLAFKGVSAAVSGVTTTIDGVKGAIDKAKDAADLAGTAFGKLKEFVAILRVNFAALNVTLLANPFVLIGVAVVLLIGALVLLWKNSETFRNIVTGAFNAVASVVKGAVDLIRSHLQLIAVIIGTLLLGPLVLAVVVIRAVVQQIAAHMGTIRAVFSAVWGAVKAVVGGAVAVVKATVGLGLRVVVGYVTTYLAVVRAVFSAAWASIRAVVGGAVAAIKAAIGGLSAIVRVVASAFGRAKTAAVTALSAMLTWVAGVPGKVLGFFVNLGSDLYSAGVSAMGMLKDGFIAGARGIVDAVKGALGKLAGLLPGSPVKAGPLRVLNNGRAGGQIAQMIADGIRKRLAVLHAAMASIGKALGDGFIRAMTNTESTIKTKVASLSDKIRFSPLNTRSENKAIAVLRAGQTKLLKLVADRKAVAAKLQAAQQQLADAISARNDLAASARNDALSFASIATASGGAPTSADLLIATLQDRLQAIRDYQRDLAALVKKGISQDLIQQIASAGVEQGGATASALAQATKEQVAQINALQKQVGSTSKSIGDTIFESMTTTGIRAAQGLVAGLQSQQKAIEAQLLRIAKSMQAAIKKALGIHSPSAVFASIGEQIPNGLVKGMESRRTHVNRALANLTRGAHAAMPITGAMPGGGMSVNFNGDIGESTANEVVRRIETKRRDALAAAGVL